MALKWVQANIHLLGGDPGRVTILGQFEGSWLAGRVTGLPIKKKIKLRVLYIFHLKRLGHDIKIVFNPILHTAWLDNHALTLKRISAKYYFHGKSRFLHTFLNFCCESRKI
jgi:hypothetical protein